MVELGRVKYYQWWKGLDVKDNRVLEFYSCQYFHSVIKNVLLSKIWTFWSHAISIISYCVSSLEQKSRDAHKNHMKTVVGLCFTVNATVVCAMLIGLGSRL